MSLLQGGIVIWSGSTLDIPNNWQLCDGTNGTPDLRNRFIVGAGDTYSVGNTGGSKNVVVVTHNHTGTTDFNSHTHTIPATTGTGGSQRPNSAGFDEFSSRNSSSNGAHTHTVTIDNTGESGTNKNLPPYFALCYIQQIS